jgi:hypothetical protein
MIVVRIVVTTLRDIETERRVVMITSQQIVRVVDKTRLMRVGL